MTTTDRRQGVNAGQAIKVPCRVATTAAITLSGTQTIDGVAVVAGDRVLVKNQSSSVDNGIYVVDSSAWDRALDFDGTLDVVTGTLIFVYSGSTNLGWWYVSTVDAQIVPGTDAIDFAQASTSLAVISAFMQTMIDDTSARVARQTLLMHKKGADVASASTLDLDTTTGDAVDVTGTTTITAITLSEGEERTVRFTGALTITHGASLVLPTSANIVTQAGDYAVFRGYSGGVVRCTSFQPLVALPTAFKHGVFTRDMSTASSTQTVTGVGFKPRFILFLAAQNTTSSQASIGVDTASAARGGLYSSHAASADTWAKSGTSYSIYAEQGGGVTYAGGVTAFREDEFDVSWVRAGAASGTLSIDYIAFR